MAAGKVDKGVRKALRDARSMVETIAKMDSNEAETSGRVERFFESLMGYDLAHITRELKWTPSLGQDRGQVKVGSCCPRGT